uniref:RING-type domain-containing protein n=1 Tax=Labrus bergylta TaxID=56723 RepID=A0A3Q3ENZ7_9LABR
KSKYSTCNLDQSLSTLSFLCSICLDVFNDPVTIPCGHNFCKNCITEHWNTSDQYRCPMCKEAFTNRPKLRVNTFISEMDDADREMAEGVRVFTALKESVERGRAEFIDTIEKKLKTTKKQAEAFIKELEQEICELMKRSTEVQQLSRSEDHLHLIQRVQSVNSAPPTKDWTEVNVCQPLYEETVRNAVAQLEETLSEEMKKLVQAELKRVQQYAVDVTLDPDTAQPNLILSEDGKQVHLGDVTKNLPDNPERFSLCVSVLGKQSFSSGRFYFEVQVKGKTGWDLGVVRESINRKGEITLSPDEGLWSIWLRNGNEYEALDDPPGLVSFYDVDSAALIYSFTDCSFTEKLFPYFSPSLNYGGKNSAPLIISPVSVK